MCTGEDPRCFAIRLGKYSNSNSIVQVRHK